MESLNGPDPNPLLPGTTISYRARVVNAHLERWLWKALNDPIFANHVDLTRVALIGHSRGGEAVVKAYTYGTPAGTTVRAVASLSPTDALSLTLTGCAFLCVYGAVDGDLFTAEGFRIYDRADPPKAQVFMYGTTHNDMCDHVDWRTERIEPPPSRMVPRPAVQAAVKAFVGAFLQWHLQNREEAAFYFDAQNTPPSLATPFFYAVKSLQLPGALIVDRFQTVPITTTDIMTTATDDPPGLCFRSSSNRCGSLGRRRAPFSIRRLTSSRIPTAPT